MTAPLIDEDGWTEAVDGDIPRVDLVGKAANGSLGFLLMKAGDGLMDPAEIRDLIAKADADNAPGRDDITMTGSPAAIAKMIAHAPVRGNAQSDMPASQLAAAVGANLRNFAQEGLMTELIAKADDTLDASEPLADSTGPLDESSPGSPDWEQLDADSAMKWTAILSRAKNALGMLAGRELQEAANGDDADAGNAWDLEDAQCALDCAIGILATYAAGEQAEADMAAIGKAAAGVDLDQLGVLEGFGALMKAGRTLSATNEAAIRGAAASLQNVLATLPEPTPDAAPAAAPAAPVAKEKENPVTEQDPAAALAALNQAAAAVEKAKGDPMTPVYDKNGELVGMVDPTNLVTIAPAAPADPEPAAEPDAPVVDPAAEAVIPGTATVQAPAPADVTKAIAADFASALAEALTPIAKQLEQNAELANTVEVLKGRLDEYGRKPNDRNSPLVNGGTGIAGIAARDGAGIDPLAELRKAVDAAPNPIMKTEAQKTLALAAIKQRFAQ